MSSYHCTVLLTCYLYLLDSLLNCYLQIFLASLAAISITASMPDCSAAVLLVLGESNVELLQREVDTGRMKEVQLKMMALQMHGQVHGVFVEKKRHPQRFSLLDILNYMLDEWYITVLQHLPAGEGLEKLKNILEDSGIGAGYLAERMT